MEMPKPGPEHQVLARLAGRWKGAEKMYPSPWAPEGSDAVGIIEAEMQIDGFFLISNYKQTVGGQQTFLGHGVYGWDAQKQSYTMHWFDSMGMDPGAPALGTLEGNVLTFRSESPMGKHRFVYTFSEGGGHHFAMAMSKDGENWQPLMEGTYEPA